MGNHIVFVTGSAVGIGREVCVSFARQGSTVVALDIDDAENEVTRHAVVEAGGTCHRYHCDIGDKAAVRAVFDDLDGKIDHIDLLVNNAAVFNNTALKGGDWEKQTAAFDAAMGSGALGAFYCTAAAAPLLAAAGDSNIINMLTNHVIEGSYITGLPCTGYDCAKFSLWRLTESWAVELKGQGTRVNGLCFGATDTPMLRGVSPQLLPVSMEASDIARAIDNVIAQGPGGVSGKSYEFGMGPVPNATSRSEIEAIRGESAGS